MLRPLLTTFILLASFLSFAQQKVKQPDLKAEYEIPKGWDVHEYYKGDWDKPGGSGICHCALAVNIFKVPSIGDEFDYIHMVVYPSDKKGAADPQRANVWQYKISHGENGDSLKTPYLKWKHYNGKLTCSGENRFKEHIAWKYQTNHQKVYYTVYFWGKPAMMMQYKGVIEKIMNSFKPL
jgi:hypothetical protein